MSAAAASGAGGAPPERLHGQAIAEGSGDIQGIEDAAMTAIRATQLDPPALRGESQHCRGVRFLHRCGAWPAPTAQRAFFRFLERPASDMAMAMACFRLVTFLPALLRSVPTFFSCMTLSTFRFCCGVSMVRFPMSSLRKMPLLE
jgi:hypothetical protein